tara:strand:- start:3077 stop:3370 length:294 start_codon:yes stop_codon:yes gene_type:complete
MKTPNSISVKFPNITNFQNFVNAEKLEKLEIWEESLAEKTLTLPIYLATNVKESDYVESYEEVFTDPPAHSFRTDDLDEYTVEIVKCPSDSELKDSE